MELSPLLQDLHLCSEQLPSPTLPPVTVLLPGLQQQLVGAAGQDSAAKSLIGRVERLFQTADPHWLFSPASANQGVKQEEESWAELQAAYGGLVSALIGCVALPLCKDDSSSLVSTAYQSIPAWAALVSSALQPLLGALGAWERGVGTRGLLVTLAPQICVFTVTHFQDQPWTSSSSRQAAESLHGALLRAGSWRDSAHLLMGEPGRSRGIVCGVLDILQPQLTRDSWQRCEAVKLVFAWTLLQVTRPTLSPHLPRLLPPSLLLNDHHRPENCMLGVRCLHHIVLNTPASDLRQFNRAEVLYQALFKHLYTTEAAVIQLVLSCLLDLLLVLERPPSSLTSSPRKPGHHDEVLRLVLTHMEAEQKVVLRRVYASCLPQYLDRMGVAVCRHLQRVERVLLGYLEIRDPPEETSRLKILEGLQTTVRAAWPRWKCRIDMLLPCLLRLLLDVSSDAELTESIRQQLMAQTAQCLHLLDSCSHGKLQCRLQQVDRCCCSSEVLGCLATVATRTERTLTDGSGQTT
ncbi:TELO2-interacting protein 2 [Aulostomus maculatus]